MSQDDERRAALWQQQERRRLAYQQQLEQDLAGDPVAAAELDKRWEPLSEWLIERQQPEVEPDDDPGHDPLDLGEQVNVGT